MLTLRFRFPSGRYHGTPWGAHVNEGLVEWPPSPWRVLRALIAVGFARMGWTEIPAAGRALLEKLSATLPTMHLPPANAAHTRHYMPLGVLDKKTQQEKTAKVFDAFAYVGDGALAITWDVALSVEEERLLDGLLDAMPYLGRAESWVEAARVDEVPRDLEPCVASDACPGPRLERVALLAPETPSAYAYWRAAAFEREVERRQRERGAKALSKKDLATADELFPKSVVDALLADTKTLQTQGWSQPPGTRWIGYWRPTDPLRSAPLPTVFVRHHVEPTTALLALASDTKNGQALPPMRDALWRMEMLHDALVRLSDREGRGPSAVFTGKEAGVPLRGHQHATLLPLTLDRRGGRIDHVLIYAPMGFDDGARAALSTISRTYAKDLPTIFVTLAGMGQRDDFAKLVSLVRSARVFCSVTPFVPPRFVKAHGRDSLDEQIQAELERRGLPRAALVKVLPEERVKFRSFRKARRDRDRAPPMRLAVGVRLEFAEPVSGPIALGYGSHFGLGCFEPGDENADG